MMDAKHRVAACAEYEYHVGLPTEFGFRHIKEPWRHVVGTNGLTDCLIT